MIDARLLILIVVCVQSQDFSPILDTKCKNGRMSVTVITEKPFKGIIYASNSKIECRIFGVGSNNTQIRIALTDFNRCGILYNPENEEYSVILSVQQHPKVILQQDKVFNVSCSTLERNPLKKILMARLGLYRMDIKVHQVIFGQAYTLRVKGQEDTNWIVADCFGFAGFDHHIQLSDANGCSFDTELMRNFNYDKEKNMAVAILPSMFKFIEESMINLQCTVRICSLPCKKVNCDRKKDDPLLMPEIDSLRLSQNRLLSTMVRVREKALILEEDYSLGVMISCDDNSQLLSSLCLLFCGLFLCSLITNLFFCLLASHFCSNDRSPSSSRTELVDKKTEYDAKRRENSGWNEEISRGQNYADTTNGSLSSSMHSCSSNRSLVNEKLRRNDRRGEIERQIVMDDLPPPPSHLLVGPNCSIPL